MPILIQYAINPCHSVVMPGRAGCPGLTCTCTDDASSRGVKRHQGLCLFNKNAVKGNAKAVLVFCSCGTRVCIHCLWKLRAGCLKEIERLQHLELFKHPVLEWLLKECINIDELLNVADSSHVLTMRDGRRYFGKFGCIFCFDARLPERARPIELIPRRLGYPLLQPLRGKRGLTIMQAPRIVLSHRNHAFACHAISCHAMPCHPIPCHLMPCHAISCHAMPPRLC
jgi:hypothetical protein